MKNTNKIPVTFYVDENLVGILTSTLYQYKFHNKRNEYYSRAILDCLGFDFSDFEYAIKNEYPTVILTNQVLENCWQFIYGIKDKRYDPARTKSLDEFIASEFGKWLEQFIELVNCVKNLKEQRRLRLLLTIQLNERLRQSVITVFSRLLPWIFVDFYGGKERVPMDDEEYQRKRQLDSNESSDETPAYEIVENALTYLFKLCDITTKEAKFNCFYFLLYAINHFYPKLGPGCAKILTEGWS
jgi:hypothetical protein